MIPENMMADLDKFRKEEEDRQFLEKRENLNNQIKRVIERTADISKKEYLNQILQMKDTNKWDFETKKGLFNNGYLLSKEEAVAFNKQIQECIWQEEGEEYVRSGQYKIDCSRWKNLWWWFILAAIGLFIAGIIFDWGDLPLTLFICSPIIIIFALLIKLAYEQNCVKIGEKHHVSKYDPTYIKHKMERDAYAIGTVAVIAKTASSAKRTSKNLSNPEKWDKI
jgi:hypothetical protein